MPETPILDIPNLYEFRVREGDEIKTYNLQELLNVEQDHLAEDMATHSSWYSYWSSALASAKRQYEAENTRLQVLHSRLSDQARDVLTTTKGKFTVGMVDDYVNQNTDYLEARLKIIDLQYFVDRLSAIVKAYDHKKDMLVNRAADLRR